MRAFLALRRSRAALFAAALLGLGTAATPVHAAPAVVFDTMPGDVFGTGNFTSPISPTQFQGILFTAPSSGTLTKVELGMTPLGASVVTLKLAPWIAGSAANDGVPGTTLDSASASLAGFQRGVVSFTGWSASLVEGTIYSLIASSNVSFLGPLWNFKDTSISSPANDGGLITYLPHAGYWSTPSASLATRVTVDAAVIPLPATLPLLALAVTLVAALGRRRQRT